MYSHKLDTEIQDDSTEERIRKEQLWGTLVMDHPKIIKNNLPKNNAAAKMAVQQQQLAGRDLKQDWADEDYWKELFKTYNIVKPRSYLLPTKHLMRKYLRKVEVSEKEYKMITAFDDLSEFQKLNPRCPLWAWLGTLMEYVVEREELRQRLINLVC